MCGWLLLYVFHLNTWKIYEGFFYSLKLARTNFLTLSLNFLSDSNCCQINESNLEDPKDVQKEDFGDENYKQDFQKHPKIDLWMA